MRRTYASCLRTRILHLLFVDSCYDHNKYGKCLRAQRNSSFAVVYTDNNLALTIEYLVSTSGKVCPCP
jgi:hypothetical protein